ncbi:hypothetical protein H2198_010352 [Neophaeococcomyces mojaviensis]|uniref:Uncharacterized protein n=1 Tax=Neophaeococcomyces mojaviensis TaxID=3383035 RepID=A0ACC2ZRU5_9EURO|nr:hypothetical protein H2198_010352 [Knufia sp. JES_112]
MVHRSNPYISSTSPPIHSRIEVLWRILLADTFGIIHPAPPATATHFLEHVTLVVVKEALLQREVRRSSLRRKIKHGIRTGTRAALGYATNDTDSNPKLAPWGVLIDNEPKGSPHGTEEYSV